MKVEPIDPPREFKVGRQGTLVMKDCARVRLSADEQVTFLTETNAEYDVARKDWGFYATPSLNGRLSANGFKTALAYNQRSGRYYIMLVEVARRADFEAYLRAEDMTLQEWLDERA